MRYVPSVDIESLAGFHGDDPKAKMPNIRAIASAGAHSDGMEAVTPTVTWPNHTTLVTGDLPGKHGVAGNSYFDRTAGKKVALISEPIYVSHFIKMI